MQTDIASLLSLVSKYNQDERLVRIQSPLDAEMLLVHSLRAHEKVSQPYACELQLLSPYAHLELSKLVGQPVALKLRTHLGTDRFLHGYVAEFRRAGSDGGFARYEARVAPWFWFLRQRLNCRIYQDKTVLEIVDEVFGAHQPVADYRFEVATGRYEKLKYCVQYNESDFDFVSRLLEDHGIHYRFDHRDDGHSLVMADDSTQSPPLADEPRIRFHGEQGTLAEDVIDRWDGCLSVAPSALAVNTFDFKQPAQTLLGSVPLDLPRGLLPPMESYLYDGAARYATTSRGEALAAMRAEGAAWQTEIFEGEGTSRLLAAGRYFELFGHFEYDQEPEEDRRFFTLETRLEAQNNFLPDYSHTEGASFRVLLKSVRRKITFRPERSTPRPRMGGPQTAIVVGPPGEELWADKYGRVKVKFHWDRLGAKDGSDSCWLRVASPWAGADMGGVSIPRIGQEVVVDFLDGDPDRPLITSRVYNADNMPPFGLHVSGLKSKTVKGGGFNEMTMHDSPGAELLNLRAQNDMTTLVLNNQANTINADKTTQVAANHTESVGINQTMTVGADQALTVKANRSATVQGTDTRTVTGTSTSTVTGAVAQTYHAGQTRTVTAAGYTEAVTGDWRSTLTGNYAGTVSGNWVDSVTGTGTWNVTGLTTETLTGGRNVSVTGTDSRVVNGPVEDSNTGARTVVVTGALAQSVTATCALHSDSTMSIDSGSQVALGVGGCGITIDGASIVISAAGSTIKVDAGGVTVNGAKINLNC